MREEIGVNGGWGSIRKVVRVNRCMDSEEGQGWNEIKWVGFG